MLILNSHDVKKLLLDGCIEIKRTCHAANQDQINSIVERGHSPMEGGDLTFVSPYGEIGNTLKVRAVPCGMAGRWSYGI